MEIINMKTLWILTKRNIKIYFKDKGMFFSSLITPIIILILYSTFLAKIYKDSFISSLPEGFTVSESIINGIVGGELFSSLLAVCCVTVAFCSNTLMAQDKVNKTIMDITVSPVNKSAVALSYFLATLFSTLIITYIATFASFIYIAIIGWFLSVSDVILILLDVFLLSIFGTLVSSIINSFLTSQGQVSAIGTIVSAGYGFFCGAYMPISQFGSGLRNTLMFLPSTYGTSLIRNHSLQGVYKEMLENAHFPKEVVEGIKDSIDCNIYFFDNKVSILTMYLIVIGSIILLATIYILIYCLRKKNNLKG